MRVYVTVRSWGMRLICSCVSTTMASVPGVLVTSSPCARFPNSFPKARDHVCDRTGSVRSFLYLVIDSPVTGCMTGAQKCSHVHGMAWDEGRVAYVWMAMALSAAVEYRRGDRRAILGERRRSLLGSSGATLLAGWAGGVAVIMGAVGLAMGALVGGELLRVVRKWMRGAVRVISGAVGLVDVGQLAMRPPFVGCHGRVAGSYPGVAAGAFPVNLRIA